MYAYQIKRLAYQRKEKEQEPSHQDLQEQSWVATPLAGLEKPWV